MRRIRLAAIGIMPALVGLLALSACAAVPATPTVPPDFGLMTPTGVESVSIRQSPPGLTDAEFRQLIAQGMESAMPGSEVNGSLNAPYPTRRIVWHVNGTAQQGVSRLVVNAFDGPRPFAYEDRVVDNSAPPFELEAAITSMTRRLATDLNERDSRAATARTPATEAPLSEAAG